MFAWILKTNPVNCSSVGLTTPVDDLARRRRRRELEELAQERLDAEVRERAAEEHRRQLAGQERLLVERVACLVEQRDVLHQLVVRLGAEQFSRAPDRRAMTTCTSRRGRAVILAALEQMHLLVPPVVDADERAVLVDRPGDRDGRRSRDRPRRR